MWSNRLEKAACSLWLKKSTFKISLQSHRYILSTPPKLLKEKCTTGWLKRKIYNCTSWKSKAGRKLLVNFLNLRCPSTHYLLSQSSCLPIPLSSSKTTDNRGKVTVWSSTEPASPGDHADLAVRWTSGFHHHGLGTPVPTGPFLWMITTPHLLRTMWYKPGVGKLFLRRTRS